MVFRLSEGLESDTNFTQAPPCRCLPPLSDFLEGKRRSSDSPPTLVGGADQLATHMVVHSLPGIANTQSSTKM